MFIAYGLVGSGYGFTGKYWKPTAFASLKDPLNRSLSDMVKVARLDTYGKSVRTVTENKNPRFFDVWRQEKKTGGI